tara:strand:+ start:4684 stop:5316 length:633 start_codon:yes stop_codon:yes gene_type:complete
MLRDDLAMMELLLDGEAFFKISKHFHDKKKGRRRFLKKWLKSVADDTSDERLSVLIQTKFLARETDNQVEKYWLWMLDFYQDMIETLLSNRGASDLERLENYSSVIGVDCNFITKSQTGRIEEPSTSIDQNIFFMPQEDSFKDGTISPNQTMTLYFHHYSKDSFLNAKAILQDFGFSIIHDNTTVLSSTVTIEGAFHCPCVREAELKLAN